ncbi:MAG: hypothetical protein EBS06_04215 [Proteobacteria bacterium]|nr:hypothetical protein [Pseudomonadota bacterium]
MSQAKKHYRVVDVSMFFLIVFVATLTALFVIQYCNLFDNFGLMAKQRLLTNPSVTFFITPVFFWVSAYLCRVYSPKASGNYLYYALNELKKDPNNFDKVSTFLNIRLVMVKAVSSLIASFSGGALGKEGPSVHMSAGILASLANRYEKLLPKINLETWVMAGTASGLAIAFNAPIAGIIFIIEKLSKAKFKNFKSNLTWTIILVSIITIIFHKPQPLFNFHNLIFRVKSESAALIFLAVSCGFFAFIFQSANNYFYTKISNIRSNWWHVIPVFAGFMVAGINFYCGIYSFSGGIYTSQQALLSATPILSYAEVIGRIFNTIITFVSGCAGGLIAPSMAVGTGIGSIFSAVMPNADIGVFLLIGMTAFLSAVLGEPITAAVVIFETTGQNIENLPFLVSAAIISSATFKSIGKLNIKRKSKLESQIVVSKS